jgi:hypothetical protein
MRHAFTRLGPLCVLVLLIGAASVRAEPGAPLASSDTNTSGVTADVIECKRREGVLTLKIRLRNTGASEARLGLIASRSYDKYYLTAGSKKYFILRDTEKTPLAPAADNVGDLDVSIPANGAYTWWAKYPAPPADVKAVNVYTPIAPPIDDVPITDS